MHSDLNLPSKLRQRVDRELLPGEAIRWIQQPILQFFNLVSIVTVIFAIPWTSFAVFWVWMAAGAKVPDFSQGFPMESLFALFGVPFVMIGIGMLLSPLWTWLSMRQTVYLITDRRTILIQGGINSVTVRTYEPNQLQNITRKEWNDGTGNVIFAQRQWRDSDGDQRTEEIGFMNIPDAREAEIRLKQLSHQAD